MLAFQVTFTIRLQKSKHMLHFVCDLITINKKYAEIRPLNQKLWRCLLSCQLMCTVILPLHWPQKTTPKWVLIHWNLSIRSTVMERSSSMSADVYSDLTIGLASKNYPKISPHMLKSVHWIKSYVYLFLSPCSHNL